MNPNRLALALLSLSLAASAEQPRSHTKGSPTGVFTILAN